MFYNYYFFEIIFCRKAGEDLEAAVAKDVKPPAEVFEEIPQVGKKSIFVGNLVNLAFFFKADVSTISFLPITPYNYTSEEQANNQIFFFSKNESKSQKMLFFILK